MKKLLLNVFYISLITAVLIGCKEDEDPVPKTPELPPVESMSVDFSDFKVETKSTNSINSKPQQALLSNYAYAGLNVGYWNLILAVNLAVPVAAFASSFQHEPTYLGNNKWQWSYTVNGFSAEYTARLTGEVRTSDVKWEMYLTKTGIGAFNEFKWFEGTSALDGLSGSWSLSRDATNPHAYLDIDWKKTNDKVGEIRYENVEKINDKGENNLFMGSYIQVELQDSVYNAKYDIHIYNQDLSKFVDINIEWSQTEYFGRVKSPAYYNDENWHCWNKYGENITCDAGNTGETGTLVDARGQTYKTVQIGEQIWMAENLRATKYDDGTLIPNVTDGSTWLYSTTPAYSWYDNDETTHSNPYGALYNWYTVETRKLCPTGWHVPSNMEWNALTDYLGGEAVAGGKLKETGIIHWFSPNTGATNETKFTAVPGGYRTSTTANSPFLSMGENGNWWSINEYNNNRAWCYFMEYDNADVQSVRNSPKANGYSVRCVKD